MTEGEAEFIESLLNLIGKNCPNLEMFEMECPDFYPDEIIHAIVPHCPNLQCLILPQMEALSDDGMDILNHYCRNIKEMHFQGDYPMEISQVGLFHFILNNPFLERITIECELQTEGILMALGRCKNLKSLWLDESEYVTDEYVIPILKSNTNIDTICFTGSCITEKTLDALSVYCTKLGHIDFIQCPYIDEIRFVEFLCMCPNVKEVTFNSESVSKDAVRKMIRRPGLKELRVSNVASKNDHDELLLEFKNLDLDLNLSYHMEDEDDQDDDDSDSDEDEDEEVQWYAVM